MITKKQKNKLVGMINALHRNIDYNRLVNEAVEKGYVTEKDMTEMNWGLAKDLLLGFIPYLERQYQPVTASDKKKVRELRKHF